jgi:MFS family permease
MNKEIFLLFTVNILSGIGYSLVAPLFPSIALKRGLSQFTIGFIISLYAITNLIVTPFNYKFFKYFGKKNVFLIAIALEVFLFLCIL